MTDPTIAASAGLVLDASVAINLFASGRALAILRAWPVPVLIERRTRREVAVLRDREAVDPRAVSSRIDWASVEQAKAIEVVDLADADLRHLVELSAEMDPGEAAAGAFAVANGLDVAIDDRKARRVLERSVTCRWSLDLLRRWADHADVPSDEITVALASIRRYARWTPHASHPLLPWWDAHVRG